MKGLFYTLMFALGVGLAVYIYFFDFQNHTEEELVRLSFAWVLPMVFGLAGMVAEKAVGPDKALNHALRVAALAALALAGGLLYFFG